MLGARCPSMTSEDRYSVHVLNVILGGGMSSRLFQTIREEHGLAYAVYSGVNAYTDAGYLSMYAATSPEQIGDVIKLSLQEFGKFKDEPVSDAELQRAKDQLKVSIMLSLEIDFGPHEQRRASGDILRPAVHAGRNTRAHRPGQDRRRAANGRRDLRRRQAGDYRRRPARGVQSRHVCRLRVRSLCDRVPDAPGPQYCTTIDNWTN